MQTIPTGRRFPHPWSTIEHADSIEVLDATGQPLAYVYFEDEPGRRAAMRRLNRDDARRLAGNIAKLPLLLGAVHRVPEGT